MNKELSKKHRIRFFLMNVLAFALIFFALGLIVLNVFHLSAYRETDDVLNSTSISSPIVQLELERYEQQDPSYKNTMSKSSTPFRGGMSNNFNTQVILWSKDGEILNTDTLGGRFTQFQNLSLNTKSLDAIDTIELQDTASDNTSVFHSVTLKNTSDEDSEVAYVQILANTNQIRSALANFQVILILCMVLFWFLSIGVSYYLSSLSMKPILASWKQQQEFVENASHELRTPLTIIQNSLQHLFTKPNRTIIEESESIAQALTETRRLTGLTNDLLVIARNDSNQQTLHDEAITVQTFLTNLMKPFQEMAELDQKTFVYESTVAPNITWIFDEKKMHQVIVILLDNALKYTNSGDTVKLISTINKEWQIEVQNTGPSISDHDKEHIFDRFYREDRSRSKETGGYGLGLAIAKQIITEHKGTIIVKDVQPKGVCFQVKLPKRVAKVEATKKK